MVLIYKIGRLILPLSLIYLLTQPIHYKQSESEVVVHYLRVEKYALTFDSLSIPDVFNPNRRGGVIGQIFDVTLVHVGVQTVQGLWWADWG